MTKIPFDAQQEAAASEPLRLRADNTEPDQASKAEALLALGHDCAARLTDPWRTVDHGALLYDDKGLPR